MSTDPPRPPRPGAPPVESGDALASPPAGPRHASAVVTLHFADEREAAIAQQALRPDNGGFVVARAEGRRLVIEAEARDEMGLLRTLDDILGCLRAAGLP